MSTTKPSSVEDTLRDFWQTRPVRPRSGRRFAGVCVAIGLRYGIDPVLVRVAFVLAALYGGAGIALYLLCWLVFPQEGDPAIEPGTREPTSAVLALVLVLALIPAMSWSVQFPGVIGLVLGLGALFLLHRHHADRNRPEPPEPTGENAWVYPAAEQRTAPPSWDPLGAAPFAWDLPEPSRPEQPPEQRPKRRWITPVALLLAACCAVLARYSGQGLAEVLAVVLGVLGLAMVAGAFLHGGRGLIAVAIPVGALAMVASALPPGAAWLGVNDQRVHLIDAAAVAPRYRTAIGDVDLDLRDARFPGDREVRTGADVGVGDVTVRVPADVDVTARCSTGIGSVSCLRNTAEGPGQHREAHDDGPDGPGGGRLVLDLTTGTGDVEVTRG
ncbi:PspC domain-containing protein [Saccharopolyspora rosea]|uniref:PspC domain-containing protein n=1 Tax=Saccharopolyspora rosea TaxID=524884 RepID=A0ABW3FKE4_9PSEU